MKNLFGLNKILFVAVTALTLAASGCKKIEDLLTFQVNDSSSFVVPGSGILNTAVLSLPGATVSSSSSGTYSANNTSADHVQDVSLDRLSLTVTDPAGQNFDFLKSVKIYIATDNSGSNKTLLASLSPVPAGQTTINLNPAGTKLDIYLRNSTYTLFTDVEMAQALRQNTTVRADSRFNVKAKLK
jgi:hypothetical protein